ncbi:Thioredoxin-like fold protein [Actinidia chinensis var. chinensis]|uniref:Thioredoxin-like fold protein n=1 Tax=Actinidia chinensis var. chinensis TaxID=1590841 RepID=A0A2R6PUF0_ACTCC|nr:Thioredoxin-like fold protein [Actinidia chinensis var. chinensis]
MAIRCTISIGRKATSSLLPMIPTYLRTKLHVPASHPLHVPISHPHAQTAFKYSIRAIHGATVDPIAPKKEDEEQLSENWKIKMLYDGECPLCMREVNMLRERNKQYGAIKFVDISSDEYTPNENQGLDYKTVMGRIHAILSDGTVVTDVEAFRKLYEAVDLGWVYAITKYEPIATIADAVYGVWAKYRLQITGRPPLEEVLEARKNKGEVCNDSKVCKM